jgi:hypothetical protein
MRANRALLIGLTTASLVLPASAGVTRAEGPPDNGGPTLVDVVREATARYRNINNAFADGYVVNGGCVSGPELGAMGVHLAKFSLFDAVLDVNTPEVLVYEPRQGGLHLVAAEYVTPAAAWDAAHPEATPQLNGHLLHFTNGPNRYGPDAFYELHVWGWKLNPSGPFADWNPRVSCAEQPADR